MAHDALTSEHGSRIGDGGKWWEADVTERLTCHRNASDLCTHGQAADLRQKLR